MVKKSVVAEALIVLFAGFLPGVTVAAPAVAIYSVPVSKNLESAASWAVRNAVWESSPDGHRRLVYRLPRALAANAEPMTLNGIKLQTSKFIRLDGPRGTAYCTETAADAVCLVSFEGEVINLPEQQRFLRETFATDPNLSRMQDVLLAFYGQPVGILRITFGE